MSLINDIHAWDFTHALGHYSALRLFYELLFGREPMIKSELAAAMDTCPTIVGRGIRYLNGLDLIATHPTTRTLRGPMGTYQRSLSGYSIKREKPIARKLIALMHEIHWNGIARSA